jgi:hypothetical protein
VFYQTVTILKPDVVTDPRYGDERLDWTSPTRVQVDHVLVAPSVQSEPGEPNRSAVVTGWHIVSQPGRSFPVHSRDRIQLPGGQITEVMGEVAEWPDPLTGRVDHYEVDVQRVTG